MRKVYSAYDNFTVGRVRQVLEDNRIRCIVRNEYLLGAAGQLPPNECWPEIWVADDSDHDRAVRILDEVLAAANAPGETWTCPGCGERIEGQFTACWNCGAEHEGE